MGPCTVYGVPLAPLIWVDGPAGVVAAAADEVSDEADDDAAEVLAEDEDPLLLLLWLHAEPINPNAAIAMENAAVRFVISRISFLSNWIEPSSADPIRTLLRWAFARQGS
jgi:hypothetical protein